MQMFHETNKHIDYKVGQSYGQLSLMQGVVFHSFGIISYFHHHHESAQGDRIAIAVAIVVLHVYFPAGYGCLL